MFKKTTLATMADPLAVSSGTSTRIEVGEEDNAYVNDAEEEMADSASSHCPLLEMQYSSCQFHESRFCPVPEVSF